MNHEQLIELAGEVRRIVSRASARIEEIRAAGPAATTKADQSPVTEADHAADGILREGLTSLVACGWLSEETADTTDRLERERVWVVDPLDGTKEFIEGLPEYSVAVALVCQGVPELGVIQNPATGDLFWAVRGGGAHRNGTHVRVREGRELLASRSEVRRGEFGPLQGDWEVRRLGSIEFKLASIAAGGAAATVSRGPKHEWDVCAGALIVTEAGGVATDMFGDPLVYNQPFPKVKGILAGAPEAHARLLSQLETLGASDRMRELTG